MSLDETKMTLIEDANMNVYWECDCTPVVFHETTASIEKKRRCPACNAKITEFVDEINEEE